MAAGGAARAANGMAGAGRRARGGRRREGAALRGRFGAREGPQRGKGRERGDPGGERFCGRGLLCGDCGSGGFGRGCWGRVGVAHGGWFGPAVPLS